MRFFLLPVALFCAGCVTSADIAELKGASAQYKLAIDEIKGEFRSGQTTQETAIARLEQAQREYDDLVDAKAEEVAKRTDEAIAGVVGLLEETKETGGILGAGGLVGLYLLREFTRRRRLKQVEEEIWYEEEEAA